MDLQIRQTILLKPSIEFSFLPLAMTKFWLLSPTFESFYQNMFSWQIWKQFLLGAFIID